MTTRTRARLVTPRFALIVASGFFYFMALSVVLPVIPHYVEDEFGGGGTAVGVAVGSFAVGALALRVYAGRIGDRFGRRVLIISGALVVAVATAMYGLVPALWWLVSVRAIAGIGEAAFFVGAATMITDLAPIERRGEAVSYWSVAVYGGLAVGPILGEAVQGDDRYTAAWLVSAALAGIAAALAFGTRDVERPPAEAPATLIARGALLPGTVLLLGLIPLAGYTAFLPLYVERFDISAGPVFLVYAAFILFVRLVGARVPDRLGGRRAGTLALTFASLGVGIVAGWPSVAGLVIGTVVLAVGMSLMYPALLLLALHDTPDSERASVVGTFSAFFDLSQGIGAAVCGVVAELTATRGAFVTGAIAAALGLALLRSQRT